LSSVKAETISSPHAKGKADGREREDSESGSTLLQPANWVRAANPTKVLYREQVLPLQSLVSLNSDVPASQALFTVMRDVYDRWGTQVLLPYSTKVIGETKGSRPAYGDSFMEVTVSEIHFPDGTILEFGGAKVGDRSGHAGIPGDVDNHVPQLIFAIAANTALSVAAKSAGGSNPYAYQESASQQYMQGVAQGVNQAGQRILTRQFDRPPTITVAQGEEVTAFPLKNIDLSKVPRIIRPRP
jgi:type IV secretory pathway VirB10-like protein